MNIDVSQLLSEILEDDTPLTEELDLIESGLLDSLAVIELFDRLADEGIELQPTRIDRSRLRTIAGITALIAEAQTQ